MPVLMGACATTTKFLDNKIFTFKILLSWRFPRKTAFLDDFPLCPLGPPPSKAQILFLLSSRCLWVEITSITLGKDRGDFGHFLRGRSLKGRCNIRVYVPVCVCVSLRSPPDPAHTVGLNSRIPPHTRTWVGWHDPSPPYPHPYLQAIAWPTPGKNYPLKSAWRLGVTAL